MRIAMMFVAAATAGGPHAPVNSQQLPPKVFELANLTNAPLEFHVLAAPREALSPQNGTGLASGARATLGCGMSKCYVVMSPGKVRGRWGVNQGSKYKFSIVHGALSLNLTS